MQPVQPSLIPDPHPGPAAPLVDHLPEEAVAAAIMLLAAVIAKTAAPEGSRWTPMSEQQDHRLPSAAGRGGLCPAVHVGPG